MIPSSRDRLETALSRIKAQTTPVFLKTYDESARSAADAADARRKQGISLGPLDGRIVSIKDLFDVAGEVTTAASKILQTAAAAQADAPIVRRLRQAGAVIIGKTNMSEFAFSGIGINPHYGTPGNAADETRIPGGSSSGAGVSAASGTSEIAIGTDTGGSIRIPAALNGCIGFKPSEQRVPKEGAFPLSYTLDSIGPLAKTVADCAAADAVMAGEAPWTVEPMDLRGLRLAVLTGKMFQTMDGSVGKAFEETVSTLARAGAIITPITIDALVESIDALHGQAPFVTIEAAAIHAEWLERRREDFDPRVYQRIIMGLKASGPDYVLKVRRRAELIQQFNAQMAPFDALLTPTIPMTAPTIAETNKDDASFFATNGRLLRFTTIGNLMDVCGVSLPSPHATGLPVGVLFTGVNGTDRRIINIAAAAERLFN